MSVRPRLTAVLLPVLAALALAAALVPRDLVGADLASDIKASALAAALTGLVMALSSHLVTADSVRRTLIGVTGVVWFGLFGAVRESVFLAGVSEIISPPITLVLWTAVIGVLVYAIRRSTALGPDHVRGVAVAVLALLFMNVPPLMGRTREARSIVPRTTIWSSERTAARPDIYVIMLDKYASPANLAAQYGLDVTPFVDSLRAMGFVVPTRARTNYVHTRLVLSTLLNGQLAHTLGDTAAGEGWSKAGDHIADARFWTLMREQGYRRVFFPTGFPQTQQAPNADLVMLPPNAPRAERRWSWVGNSPLDVLPRQRCADGSCVAPDGFPYPVETAADLRAKLAQLTTLPDSVGPTATFLHFLGSHEPYLFNEDCSDREPWWPPTDLGPDSTAIRRAYATQIRCVNLLLLDAVQSIVTRSAVPPVIILQSDHGHGLISRDPRAGITLSMAEAGDDRVRDRLEVFAAYRLPDGPRLVYDSITPVNVLPLVADALFGTTTLRSPDVSYWSTYQAPLSFTIVPPTSSR